MRVSVRNPISPLSIVILLLSHLSCIQCNGINRNEGLRIISGDEVIDLQREPSGGVRKHQQQKQKQQKQQQQQQQQQLQQQQQQQQQHHRQLQDNGSSTTGPSLQFQEFMQWVARFRTREKPPSPPTLQPTKLIRPTAAPTSKPQIVTTTTTAPQSTLVPTSIEGLPDPGDKTTPTSYYCTCPTCTSSIWNKKADDVTCGDRIIWVRDHDTSVGGSITKACTLVANQFPTICGPNCNPTKCPRDKNAPTPAPTKYYNGDYGLYCYPDKPQRKRYTNVWSKYTLEVREKANGCDPNGNLFNRSTVSVNSAKNELKLQFAQKNGIWTASEVRVLLPTSEMPYSYGTYKYRLKSVVVKNGQTGKIKANNLPASLVLGFFTWDPTDDYSTRENFSHEVDIELSRWAKTGSNIPDALLLVQPNGPHAYRFFTGGANKTLNQGNNNVYQFTWNPGAITWQSTAGGGVTYKYTTAQAIQQKRGDYVQCLPANTEIRFNLWNWYGTDRPLQVADGDFIEAVIDSFSFTPSGVVGVANGGPCTKSCQCLPSSTCSSNVCRRK